MWQILLALVFALLTLTAVTLQKTYVSVPVHEVKRRAQAGDPTAQILYRVVAYGASLRVFLWLLIGVSATGLFFVVARTFPWPLALIGILVILWLSFAWLPTTKVTKASRRLAQWLTPPLAWLLNFLNPALNRLSDFIRHRSPPVKHTHLYQADDLVALLEQQRKQADNRIAKEEIEIAIHGLTFGDKLVRDHMTPLRQVKLVKKDDSIGPVLLDELHATGHSRFPVYDGKKSNIVGTLFLHDLVKHHQTGSVSSAMRRDVYYVHEEQSLYQALTAFLKVKHHLFIVVNRFEEMVGVLSIEDVIEQIIGQPIMDEFDQYEDLRAVAGRMAREEHVEHKDKDVGPEPPKKVVDEKPTTD